MSTSAATQCWINDLRLRYNRFDLESCLTSSETHN